MSEPHTAPRYVLTNRMNLNGILSSRIIGPRASFSKYYQDLLDLTGNRVAILDAPPAADAVAYVTAKSPTGAALLEISPGRLGESRGGIELVHAVPFSRVTAIHLPDEKSHREHLARRYKNIHPHDHLLQVSPELFDGTMTLERVTAAGSLPKSDEEAVRERDWQRIDRIRGAMSAGVLTAVSSFTLNVAADLLPGRPSKSAMSRYIRHGTPPPEERPDDALISAIVDVLITTDTAQAWNPPDLVTQIRGLVADRVVGSELAAIEANLDSVTAIVTNAREFTPFRRAAHGLRSAKALLLVLLREDLTSLLDWSADETGADDRTRQLAAVFAGLLRGITREKISTRALPVDDHTAAWACVGDDGLKVPRVSQSMIDSHLQLGDDRLRTAPRDLGEIVGQLEGEQRQAALSALAVALPHDDIVTIEVTSSSHHTSVTDAGLLSTVFPGSATVVYHCDTSRLAKGLASLSTERSAEVREAVLQRIGIGHHATPASA